MPTDWSHFRKIAERPSVKFLKLPLVARSICHEMTRIAEKPSGRVCDSCDPDDLAFALRAHDDEYELVHETLKALLANGTLEAREDGLYMPNFAAAQESDSAKRAREWRDTKRAKGSPNVRERNERNERNEPQSAPSQDQTRPDQTRPERDPPNPPEGGDTHTRPAKRSKHRRHIERFQAASAAVDWLDTWLDTQWPTLREQLDWGRTAKPTDRDRIDLRARARDFGSREDFHDAVGCVLLALTEPRAQPPDSWHLQPANRARARQVSHWAQAEPFAKYHAIGEQVRRQLSKKKP